MAPIVISEEAKRAANLRVLQKNDTDIADIIGSATHVVLYEFNTQSNAWENCNVEGSLFVVKRSSTPRFQMIIMNRNSKDNLVVSLAKTFQMQVREPYLIFRFNTNDKAPQKVRGIWFHDDKERNKIVQILDKAVKSLSMAVEETAAPKAQPVDKTEAAASIMAALKMGGSNQTAPSASEPKSQPQRQPQAQAQEPNVQNMVLDKKSLQLSLMSLLQEDKFLDIIHAQYVKVAKARAASGNQK